MKIPPTPTPKLDKELRDILFSAAGGISDMAEQEIAQIQALIQAEIVKARIDQINRIEKHFNAKVGIVSYAMLKEYITALKEGLEG